MNDGPIQIEIEDLVSLSKAGAKKYGWFMDYLWEVFKKTFPQNRDYIDLTPYKIYDPKGLVLGVGENGKCVFLNGKNDMEIIWLTFLDIETFVSVIEKFVEMKDSK